MTEAQTEIYEIPWVEDLTHMNWREVARSGDIALIEIENGTYYAACNAEPVSREEFASWGFHTLEQCARWINAGLPVQWCGRLIRMEPLAKQPRVIHPACPSA